MSEVTLETFRKAALKSGERLRDKESSESKAPKEIKETPESISDKKIAITVAARIAITMQSERAAKLEKLRNRLGLEHQAFFDYIKDAFKENS